MQKNVILLAESRAEFAATPMRKFTEMTAAIPFDQHPCVHRQHAKACGLFRRRWAFDALKPQLNISGIRHGRACFIVRAFLICVMGAISVPAAEVPAAVIQSAEQAVDRFKAARDTDPDLNLTASTRRYIEGLRGAASLSVRKMKPRDYELPNRDRLVSDENAKARLFGTLAAAAAIKTDTWRLYYDTGLAGSLVVYLDGVTGRVLYIHCIPEG